VGAECESGIPRAVLFEVLSSRIFNDSDFVCKREEAPFIQGSSVKA